MTDLYTVDALHADTGISKDTIYDWLKSGELRGFKLGVAWRVHPDDWDEFIERRRKAS
jgi:excisionase family DNA binding protein